MNSARHGHPGQPPGPSRRGLLRGGAALGVASALAAGATGSALAGPRHGRTRAPADYPGADWIPAHSSNYTASSRPSSYPVRYVVIHVTQETYPDTLDIFRNPDKNVSAHYVVRSSDGNVAQLVRDHDIAWHAGNWDYNTMSIGIEHEGWVDEPAWFTHALYASSASLTAHLCDTYGIPQDRDHIIGHHEVPGATHTDPGPHWDWDRYLDMVHAR